MGIDALVFDFDGLILDTEWPKFVAVSEAFAAHGSELPIDEWRAAVGRTDERHWTEWLEDALGHPIDRPAVRAAGAARSIDLLQHERILPGVAELLDDAVEGRVLAAVASSSSREWVVSNLERLGLLDRFDVVVTAEDVVTTKPAPDLYLRALAELDASADRSIALEDSAHGCTSAVAAGLRCVAAPNRLTVGQDFGHADLLVGSLADLSLADLVGLVDGAGHRSRR